MKYDKMIEITQAESQRKMEIAKKVIYGMLESMERITVAELVKRTGLSRGFFYKNPMVRSELNDAIRKQEIIFKNRNPVIMSKDLENQLIDLRLELLRAKTKNEELETQNAELFEHNKQLSKEIETLKKQLGRKEVSLLKKL